MLRCDPYGLINFPDFDFKVPRRRFKVSITSTCGKKALKGFKPGINVNIMSIQSTYLEIRREVNTEYSFHCIMFSVMQKKKRISH